jgi:Leucine-rich repeat (LRR) protein
MKVMKEKEKLNSIWNDFVSLEGSDENGDPRSRVSLVLRHIDPAPSMSSIGLSGTLTKHLSPLAIGSGARCMCSAAATTSASAWDAPPQPEVQSLRGQKWDHCCWMTSLSDIDCLMCLTQIVDLQKLILSHNQISALDEALGNLSSLTILDVSHNLLTRLPNTLGRYFTCILVLLVCHDVSVSPSEIILSYTAESKSLHHLCWTL